MRLARVGYENIAGLLDGGVEAWKKEGLPVAAVPQEDASKAIRPGRRVLDVRRKNEWDMFHLKDATLMPLADLPTRVSELDASADWVIVCASGYRSLMAASVLERAGFKRITNADGGMDEYYQSGQPVVVGSGD